MKKYFLILAVLCMTAFWSCEDSDLPFEDGSELPGGDGNGDDNGDNNSDGNGDDNGDDSNGDGENDDIYIPEDMEDAFPDPIFRAYVLENFDTDGDGKISEEEALKVTQINVSNKHDTPDDEKITSLEGVQYFTNLTKLNCTSNQLTSLDVSKNTKLTSLLCYYNRLTSLDVSKNTKLTELKCYSNQLTSLDVSKISDLISLSCYSNRLTSLDVSKNMKLQFLFCWSNQLTSLDVSQNSILHEFGCSENKLTTLDLSKNTALTYLDCSYNQLTTLDISKTSIGDTTEPSPLNCGDNPLKTLYLKTGWSIQDITPNRNPNRIPEQTEIVFVD